MPQSTLAEAHYRQLRPFCRVEAEALRIMTETPKDEAAARDERLLFVMGMGRAHRLVVSDQRILLLQLDSDQVVGCRACVHWRDECLQATKLALRETERVFCEEDVVVLKGRKVTTLYAVRCAHELRRCCACKCQVSVMQR
jgi:hypothetical protein